MDDAVLLARISASPDVLGGKPVIAGTRLSVEYVLNLLGHGSTVEEVIAEYRGLVPEDVLACVLFAKNALADSSFMPLPARG